MALGAGVALIASLAVSAAGSSPAAATSSRAMVAVSARASVPARATALGALDPDRTIRGTVALQPRSQSALAAYIADVSNPASPNYHHYLPAGAFGPEFGPTSATVDGVVHQLRSSGLHVGAVSANRLLVPFSGPARRVAAAFGTGFASYRLANGRMAYATTSAARLPAAVAGGVQAVVGLSTLSRPQPMLRRHTAKDPKGAVTRDPAVATTAPGPVACKPADHIAREFGGLTDDEIAGAYGAGGLYRTGDTGAGQHIAIFELEPFSPSDLTGFDACYFGAKKAASMAKRVSVMPVDGGEAAGHGSGEAALDVQDVSALAPGASIDVYEAPPTNAGYLDNLNAIVQGSGSTVDPIVSTSWGSSECEQQTQLEQPGLLQIENTLFEQAAAQGQTVLAASGDDGSDSCAGHGDLPVGPVLSVSDPASQPYVTAVGGTTIEAVAKRPTERVWDDGSELGASGGGVSAVWDQPFWQKAATSSTADRKAVTAAETTVSGSFCQAGAPGSATTSCRQVPDISAQGDEITGAITIELGGRWTTIGGTSSATPLWAAMLADVNASKTCAAQHSSIGFVTPALYAIAGEPAEAAASFNDVTTGSSDIFGAVKGLFKATAGYDAATGIGTPRLASASGGHGLAYYLCAQAAKAPPTISNVSPQFVSTAAGTGSGSAGSPQTVTLTGAGFESGGVSDVAGVTVGSYALPSTDIQVSSDTTVNLTFPPGTVQAGNGNPGGGSGTYDIAVALTGGVSSRPSSAARVIFINDPGSNNVSVPRVLGVSPSAGVESGGSTVTVYGTGFNAGNQPAAGVTFGGVAASSFTVLSDSEIRAVVPTYSGGSTTCETATDSTNDVCQSQVQVTSGASAAKSTLASSLPTEFSGNLADAPASGAGLVAQPTEFDYVPAPHLTSITFPAGTEDLASEFGVTEVVLNGTGLGALGLDWVDVGSPKFAGSMDSEFVSLGKGTSIDLFLRGTSLAPEDLAFKVTAQTAGSPNQADLTARSPLPSNALSLTYAALPQVTNVTTSNPIPAGPESGGTQVTVHGHGFTHAFAAFFEDAEFGASEGAVTGITVGSGGKTVTFRTSQENPGIDDVLICDLTGCSLPPDAFGLFIGPNGIKVVHSGHFPDVFTFFPPGSPTITSVSPQKVYANGLIVIHGTNLGLAKTIYLGDHKARFVENAALGFLDTGDTTEAAAIVPRGLKVGQTVNVRVTTAESLTVHPAHPKSPVNAKAHVTIRKAPKRRSIRPPH